METVSTISGGPNSSALSTLRTVRRPRVSRWMAATRTGASRACINGTAEPSLNGTSKVPLAPCDADSCGFRQQIRLSPQRGRLTDGRGSVDINHFVPAAVGGTVWPATGCAEIPASEFVLDRIKRRVLDRWCGIAFFFFVASCPEKRSCLVASGDRPAACC